VHKRPDGPESGPAPDTVGDTAGDTPGPVPAQRSPGEASTLATPAELPHVRPASAPVVEVPAPRAGAPAFAAPAVATPVRTHAAHTPAAEPGRWAEARAEGVVADADRRAGLARIESKAFPPETRLAGFVGSERLSTLYSFDAVLYLAREAELDLLACIGERASLQVHGAGIDEPYTIHGIITAIEHLGEQRERAAYLATLSPALSRLSLSRHSRVFTDVSVPEIIEAVLTKAGITEYAFRLASSYPKRDHVCQYKESDLAFISRLMERDGMYYFFAQESAGERLIVVDDRCFHEALAGKPVRYDPWSVHGSREDAALVQLTVRAQALPAAVELSDYDCLKPSLDVRGRATVAARGSGEVVLYGENTLTPEESARVAQVRAEQFRAEELVYRGEGRGRFHAGFTFGLEDHPRASFNAEYLVVGVEHRCKVEERVNEIAALADVPGGAVYNVTLQSIKSTTQFRAPEHTKRPRIDGLVDGITDGGAESPYAQIDAHGRYRVRLFFDESDLADGSASTWVRMLQPHGGGVEGMHFPLRKGTEVHIAFLGGDPDRPVIVGVAPNALKPSKVTESNHSKNVIMTGGSNRLELEDLAGAQYATLSTPAQSTFLHLGTQQGDGYNLVASTQGNTHEYTGGYRDRQTVGHQTEVVTGFVKGTYESTVDTTVVGALTETYQATHTRTTTGPTTRTLNDTLNEHVVGAVTLQRDSTLDETVVQPATYIYSATKYESVESDLTLVVSGPTNETHNNDKTTTIAGIHSLAAGGAQTFHSDTEQSVTAPQQSFEAGGLQELISANLSMQASTDAVLQSPAVTINADGSVTVTSANVTISGSTVTVMGGEMVVSHGKVTIEGGTVDIGGGAITLN
jgi:type VI secretion system secreted protein VgrG